MKACFVSSAVVFYYGSLNEPCPAFIEAKTLSSSSSSCSWLHSFLLIDISECSAKVTFLKLWFGSLLVPTALKSEAALNPNWLAY